MDHPDHEQQHRINIDPSYGPLNGQGSDNGGGDDFDSYQNLSQVKNNLKEELGISMSNPPDSTHLSSASLTRHASEEGAAVPPGCSVFAILCGESSIPALQHFRDKLQLGFRGAIAACLTTGLSYLWSWSGTSTWLSIVFAVAVMKKNLGETIGSFLDVWKGVFLVIPSMSLLSFLRHSRIWTAVGFYVAIVLIYVNSGTTELAKRLSAVILSVVILYCAVDPQLSYYEEACHMLLAVAFANLFAIVALILPEPRLAILRTRTKLKSIRRRLASLLRAFDLAFSMNEDVHFSMIAQLIEEAHAALGDVKQRLPYIKWEIVLFRLDPQMHTRVAAYAQLVEQQLHLFKGMQASLQCIQPNRTHANFLLFLQSPLSSLMQASVSISDEVANVLIRHLRLFRCFDPRKRDPLSGAPESTKGLTELLKYANRRLEELSMQFLKARLAILYGLKTSVECQMDEECPEYVTAANQQVGGNITVDVMPSPATMPDHPLTLRGGTRLQFIRRGPSGELMVDTFVHDHAKLGYNNVLPRNAFMLDLSLYVRTLEHLVKISCGTPGGHPCTSSSSKPPEKVSFLSTSRCLALMKALFTLAFGTCWPSPADWLQSFKISLTITIASLGVLIEGATTRLGPAPIWSVISACFVSSSHPASSFQGGFSRIFGTCLGAMYGLCIMEWLRFHSPIAITLSLTVWIFLCCFHRESLTHGGIAVVAAFTAPIIMVGPLRGVTGAVNRIEQTIAGVMLYFAIDNIFCPKRAKLQLREELATSIEVFSTLWKTTLDLYLDKNPSPLEEVKQEIRSLRTQLKASFCKQEKLIVLAEGEPELWHKPFQAKAYRKVLSSFTHVSCFMSMLIRASTFLPNGLNVNDFEMLELIKRAVEDLQYVNSQALKEAHDVIITMKERQGVKDKALIEEALAAGNIQSLALLRLRKQYTALQEFVDSYMEEYFRQSKEKTEHVLASGDVILCMNGVLFALRSIGEHMLSVGHAIRELVEGESNSYYLL